MAIQRWRGDAVAVAMVQSLTPAAMIPGDEFVVTINGKAVTYTTTAATAADVCTGMQSALAASTIAEFIEIGWTNPASTAVVATAALAGRPFTLSTSVVPASVAVPVMGTPTGTTGGSLVNGTTYYYVMTATNSNGQTTQSAQVSYAATSGDPTAVLTWTAVPGATGYKIYRSTTSGTYGASSLLTTIGSGSTVSYNDTGAATSSGTPPGTNTASSPATFTTSNVTTSSGPNDWSVGANWSTGSVPASGDSVYITGTSTSILYGLSQSAVTLTLLQIDASFTGTIGNPNYNPSGYYEYRPTYLAIGATTTTIGENGGAGSGRMQLNFGTVQTTISVYATAAALDTGLTALQIQGTNSSNVLYAYSGNVGCAVSVGEMATFATIAISYITNQASDVTFFAGPGLTLTTLNMYGGSVTLNSGFATCNAYSGTLFVLGTGAATTITLDGASCVWYSNGTISTLNVGPNGTIDFSKDSRTKTVTTTTVYAGATLNDPNKVVTYSNGIAFSQCRIDDVTLDLGENRTIALAV